MCAQTQDDSVVFIGRKPAMNYVLACLTMFQNGSQRVVLKARGLAISKAVDTAQFVTRRYAPDTIVAGIRIGTERVEMSETGPAADVSSIEILLTKK